MLVARAAGPADIDALLELAALSGKGFTSLPAHAATISKRLELSARSFAGTVAPSDAWYMLALEDEDTGRVEGVSAVKAAVGTVRPHFSFRVITLAQCSPLLSARFDHQALMLVNECGGYSEVGTLFLRPGMRKGGAGALIARSRYMLIAAARDLFAETVMAELRGWFDAQDHSPFFEGVTRKFFRMPFDQADRMMTSTDGGFVRDLAPRHPIYVELIEQAARDAIGKVHELGEPALSLLQREGFSPSGLIDLFDGGPTVTCRRDAIATIRKTRSFQITIGSPELVGPTLVSKSRLTDFRVVSTPALIKDDLVVLSSDAARALDVESGEMVNVCE